MSMLEFLYEDATGKRWEDERPEIKAFVIVGWDLALQAMKKQSELLEIGYEIR